MIKICIADNQPVVHYGLNSYFKGNSDIQIVSDVTDFESVVDAIKSKSFDILVVDLELEGISSINDLKGFIKDYPETKVVVYTNLSEKMYTSNTIKAGASAYVHKSEILERLESAIIKVSQGEIIFSEDVRKKLIFIAKQNKSDRLYRKLSSREIEVLRYLSEGKKNNEVAKILNLNEKTVSTYKLRLLQKLHVTNLVDLVNKAKSLDVF